MMGLKRNLVEPDVAFEVLPDALNDLSAQDSRQNQEAEQGVHRVQGKRDPDAFPAQHLQWRGHGGPEGRTRRLEWARSSVPGDEQISAGRAAAQPDCLRVWPTVRRVKARQ
jgi:hypothetical protein